MRLNQDWRYFIEVMPYAEPSFPDCWGLAIWLFPTWQPQLFPSFAVSNMPHAVLDLDRLKKPGWGSEVSVSLSSKVYS